MEWRRTFEYSASIEDVWRAFWETDEPTVWNNPIKGDAYISQGAVQSEVNEFEPGRMVRWTETEGDDVIEMTVSLEESETGTRLTITRSGFGSGDEWTSTHSARLLGWEQALHDLGVFLESGLTMGRIHEWRSAFGVELFETAAGLRAGNVRPGAYAEEAGMQPGDLVIRIGGVPVFTRSDQWLLQRLYRPGDEVEIEYIRDGAILRGRGAMSPLSMW